MGIAIPIAAVVVAAVGTAVSAVGAAQSAKAQQNAANYQAQVARNNATIAEQNAEAATRAGQAKATDTSLRARALLGTLSAAEGASGVDVNTGSAVETRETQREMGQLDTEREVHNATLQAYGYRSQSTGFAAQAGLDTMTAKQAAAAAPLAVGSTLLSGASSVADKFAKLQTSGAF